MAEEKTLGRAISEARQVKNLSQKDLAARIIREDGRGSISPQYLNDIEHDRRVPGADHMIKQFAAVLEISPNFLSYLANRVPAQLRGLQLSPDDVDRFVKSAVAFRRTPPRVGGK